MFKILQKYPLLSISLIVIISLIPLASYLEVTIMEARNLITAREMINDGNWFLTTMNGIARYQKPPLPTWLTALSALIFGAKSILALRAPGIIMVVLLGIFVYKLSDLLVNNKKTSIVIALISVTSLYILAIIIEAPWDIYTHTFMLMGIYYIIKESKSADRNIINAILSGIFIGFSFLSKGPISLYTILLPFLLSYFIVYGIKSIPIKRTHIFILISLALLVGLSWFVAVRLLDPEAFKHIAQKETSNWSSYNVKPFYYYWDFFVQSGIWTIPSLIGLYFFFINKNFKINKEYRFVLLWTVLSVILLSIVPEKKNRYVVPALIPLAFTTGIVINYITENFKLLKSKLIKISIHVHFIIISLIAIISPIVIEVFFIKNLNHPVYHISFILLSIAVIAAGIYTLINLFSKNIDKSLLGSIILFALLINLALPLSNEVNHPDFNPVDKLKERALNESVKVYGYKYIAPEVIWQYGDKIEQIEDSNDSIVFPKDKKFWLLSNNLEQNDLDSLNINFEVNTIEKFNLNNPIGKFGSSRKRLKLTLYEVINKNID